MKTTYGWTPQMDSYLRHNFGRLSLGQIAKVLTEYRAAASGDARAVCTPDEVQSRAQELGLAANGGPAGVALNIHHALALRQAGDESLKLAGQPDVQKLFLLLTGADGRAMGDAVSLIQTELYNRQKRNGKKK